MSPRADGVRAAYFNQRGFAVLDALDGVAAAHGSSVAAVALAWLARSPRRRSARERDLARTARRSDRLGRASPLRR